MSSSPRIETLGQLKAAVSRGEYRRRPVKDEVRENLSARLRRKEPLFPGIIGYEETVVPQLANAILSRQHTDSRFWRDIPHAEIDRAVEAADRLVHALGPDAIVPGMDGQSAAGLRIKVRYVASLAEPHRPKARRA